MGWAGFSIQAISPMHIRVYARTRRFACLALAALIAASFATGTSGASTVTVTASVASHSSMSTTCKTGTANVTSFGAAVLPGASAVTSSDCSVVFGSNNDTAMLRAYQADGAGTAMYLPPAGALDSSFGSGGKASIAVSSTGEDTANAVAVQSDDRTVLAGQVAQDFAVARLNVDGSADTSFGCATPPCSGWARTAIGSARDEANGVLVQPDGKILLAGSSQDATPYWNFTLVRYNANGTLDTGFGSGGMVVASVVAGDDLGYSVALQPDGKILVAGSGWGGASGNDVMLARFNTDGTLDANFGSGGKVVRDAGGNDYARSMTLLADGKIVIGGYTSVGGTQDWMLMRFTAAGAVDTTFGTSGTTTTAVRTGEDRIEALVERPDGKLVVAGRSLDSSGNRDIAVGRYSAAGVLDTTFGTSGYTILSADPLVDDAKSIYLQPDGRIVTVGRGSANDVVLARFLENGTVDTALNGTGILMFNFAASKVDGEARAVTAASDGRYVIAGFNAYGNTGNMWAARLSSTAVSDFSGTVSDWSTAGTNMFGACLRSVAGAGVVGTWTVDANADCTATNSDPWNPLARTAATPGSKVAASTTVGTIDATANLRFGIRAASSQKPGGYIAPIVFEVVAPNA